MRRDEAKRDMGYEKHNEDKLLQEQIQKMSDSHFFLQQMLIEQTFTER